MMRVLREGETEGKTGGEFMIYDKVEKKAHGDEEVLIKEIHVVPSYI